MFTITPSSALTQPVRSAYDYAEIYGGRCQKLELAMTEYEEIVQRIAVCTLCALSEGRTRTVPGDGSATADIMFIGEAPGFNEDQQGLPFVGAAGNVLTNLLSGIGLRRSDVYITNMVKCRPDNNRDPLSGEIEACSTYLDAQIDLIDPKVIVTLGRYSFGKFFPGTQHQPRAGQASLVARAYDLSDVSSRRYAAQPAPAPGVGERLPQSAAACSRGSRNASG